MQSQKPMEGGPADLAVLVADGQRLMAESIGALLEQSLPCKAKAVISLDAALQAARDRHYDIILYDTDLPGAKGLESIQRLAQDFPDSSLVLFSDDVDEEFLANALKAGLRGYLPKSMPLRSLAPTINLLKSGEIYIPAQKIRELQSRPAAARPSKSALTDHERDLLRLIRAGMTNKEIAIQLDSNENRIKMALRSLFQKIGARNRVHALSLARAQGQL